MAPQLLWGVRGCSLERPRRGSRGTGALGKCLVRGCSYRVPAPSRRERAQRGLPDSLAAALVAFPKGTDGGCWSHVPPLPAFQPPRHSQQRGPGTPSVPWPAPLLHKPTCPGSAPSPPREPDPGPWRDTLREHRPEGKEPPVPPEKDPTTGTGCSQGRPFLGGPGRGRQPPGCRGGRG